VANGRDCQYLIVHSGRVSDDYSKLEHELNLPFRETVSTTRHDVIHETYEKAVRENVPMVVSGTYHSAARIAGAGIPVEIIFCDEAHYLVQEQFSWIVSDPFPSTRAFYFTATLRETPSAEGMGMNNVDVFGEVLYQEKPAALIEAGEMVRPRMHMVDMSHDPDGDEGDGLAVAAAFEEHRSVVNTGAKLLVVSKDGSDHLNALATHPEIQRLREVRPALKVFDISSAHGARVDGVPAGRTEFLAQLRNLSDTDEAIIIHHDILAEGIDVPGITGVMPLISLQKAKFLQTLGRATRLHGRDRSRLYDGSMVPADLKRFIKPYAWLIIPVYGMIGDDLREDMKEMVRELRDHGFNPAEDIVVRQRRGRRELVPISVVNEPTRAMTGLLTFSADVLHEIEEEEKANAFSAEVAEFSKKSYDEKLDELFG
jgi:superfamily II DNA or RNA helicase